MPSLNCREQKKHEIFRKMVGFTMVELLIAMVILVIVSGAALMLASTFSSHFVQSNELSTARQRGIMAVTYLENRVLQGALGMPGAGSAETDFRTAFNDLLTGPSSADLSAFNHAVNIIGDNELLLAYAMPSGLFTVTSNDCSAYGTVTVALSEAPDPTKIAASSAANNYTRSTEGWVTFPSFGRAFSVETISGSSLTLRSRLDGYLGENSEMYYVRFLRGYVSNETFYAEDVTRQSPQPVVKGIIGCQFSWDIEEGLLTVAVLARGDRRNNAMVSPQTLAGWDGNIPNDVRHYYLSVVRRGWRVRN
jgi:prepilin-type N-terminal cleavage/methylation domain-containing protein